MFISLIMNIDVNKAWRFKTEKKNANDDELLPLGKQINKNLQYSDIDMKVVNLQLFDVRS